MVGPTPRERRQERTREAILDAARHIINDRGPQALSMRALARRIDYSPAGLYEYFEGKEAIIAAVCQQGHAKLTQVMQCVDDELDPAAYLRAIGLAYIDFAVTHPDYFLLMFTTSGSAAFPNDPVEHEAGSFQILVHALQRLSQAGLIAAQDEQALFGLAYEAWALVHGVAMLRITALSEQPLDFAALDSQLLGHFLKGVQAAG